MGQQATRTARSRARAAMVLLAAVALVFVATGCWPEEGFDASRSGFTPFEQTLTAANVGGLKRVWGVNAGATAGTPITMGNNVFVAAGDAVEAFNTAAGSPLWVTHNTDDPQHQMGVPVIGPL